MPFDVPTIFNPTNPLPVPAHVRVLAGALKRVQGGWCKGTATRSWLHWPVNVDSPYVRRYCAGQAIDDAALVLNVSEAVKNAARRVFLRVTNIPNKEMAIPRWNDSFRRRKWHVTAAFHEAIETAMRDYYANVAFEVIAAG